MAIIYSHCIHSRTLFNIDTLNVYTCIINVIIIIIIIKLAEKYLTRQNSAMSGQNSVCLDTMTEQCVKVIFGSAI